MSEPAVARAAEPLTYENIADAIVTWLRRAEALPPGPPQAPWDLFGGLSELVHTTYEIPSTTLTPMMRRLLFALGCASRATHLVGVGTFVGYAFSWLLRNRADPPPSTPAWESAVGFEIDGRANALARRNCAVLGHGGRLEFVDADALVALGGVAHPIDLLYLDLDAPATGKAGYRAALAAALPRLRPGALVLAHDPCVPRFAGDIGSYHQLVESSGRLAGPWILPVDPCGLSVAAAR